MVESSRRQFLTVAGGATVGALLPATGTASASNEVTFKRTFVDSVGDAIPNARIDIPYRYKGASFFETLYTDNNGQIETKLPGGVSTQIGFYKSSEEELLAPRLDGVPHIYTAERITVADEGSDTGEYELPEAYILDVRAILAEQRGVEDAVPTFASVTERSYFGSGYYSLTTNENGNMKLKTADFTGVEMAGDTRVWMYPPGYNPDENQGTEQFAPYAEETIRNVEVTEDTSIEVDMSRRKKNKKKRRGR